MLNKVNTVKFIRIFLGAVFILSAVAKILSLEFFDDLVAKQLLGADYLTEFNNNFNAFHKIQWLTRIIIAGEFMLGVAVLQDKHLKNIVFPAIIILLIAFIVQVVYAASFQGKGYIGGNCGCFGDIIPFDNRQTIIKNIVMIVMALVAYKWYKPGESMNIPPVIIPYVVGFVTFITLIIPVKKMEPVVPVYQDNTVFQTTNSQVDTVNNLLSDSFTKDSVEVVKDEIIKIDSIEKLDRTTSSSSIVVAKTPKIVDAKINSVKDVVKEKAKTQSSSIYAPYTNFSNGEVKNLDKGTHLICMFSYVCGHCQATYRDILELEKLGGDFGGKYILGYGSDFDKQGFWNKSGGVVSPHITIEEYVEFGKILNGVDFPKIVVVKDGVVQKEWNLDTYTKEKMFDYFGISIKKNDPIPDPNSIDLDGGFGGGNSW